MSLLKIAHLSDPHFATVTYNPNQFLSKRWLGNCNLLLFRNKTYQTDHLGYLPDLLSSLHFDAVAITGDFTTTSLPEEYQKAKFLVDAIKNKNIKTFVLPGNHDIYTKESERKKRFAQFFPSSEKNGVEVLEIKKNLFWIGLHCAYASNLFLSDGIFSSVIEQELVQRLDAIPKEAFCIMGNHFPLFTSGNFRHDLRKAKRLQAVLKNFPQVKIYLHGHIHKPAIRQEPLLPLVLNSGSVAHLPGGTFYSIEIFDTGCNVKRYCLQNDLKLQTWKVDQDLDFSFTSNSS